MEAMKQGSRHCTLLATQHKHSCISYYKVTFLAFLLKMRKTSKMVIFGEKDGVLPPPKYFLKVNLQRFLGRISNTLLTHIAGQVLMELS